MAEIPLTDFGDIRDGKRQPLPAAYNTITQNEVRKTRLVGVPNATPPEMYIGDNLSEYHQAVRRIADGVSHSIQETATSTVGHSETPEYKRDRLEKQADDLMPLILEQLRNLAPPEARAIAGEAAESRPLDGVSLRAISDWLKEQNFDSLADEIARLKPGAGEVCILQIDHPHNSDQWMDAKKSLENIAPGKFLLLPYGLDLLGIIRV